MASKFHERLVEARRDGTAPTNTSAPATGALPHYNPIPENTPLYDCSICGAAMAPWRTPDHTAWHLATGH